MDISEQHVLLEVKAGRMLTDSGKVKPDPSKGLLRIVIDMQGLKKFEWVNLNNNQCEEVFGYS